MTTVVTDLVPAINESFDLNLPATVSLEELRQKLSLHINHLINHDFEKLIYYLYRIDVNEKKMRELLERKTGENAADLIAGLIIQRQSEKIKSRREFRQRDNNIDENEKW
jgi:hypothetical protein